MISSLGRKKNTKSTKVAYKKYNSSVERTKSKNFEFESALKGFLKTQLKLEDRITRRIEEKLGLAQKIDQDLQPNKFQELEEQIQKLKAENELNQRIKLEKELELEKFRIRKTLEPSLPMISNVPQLIGASNYFNPAFFPYFPGFHHPQVQPAEDSNLNPMTMNLLSGQYSMYAGPAQGNLPQNTLKSRSANTGGNLSRSELVEPEEKKIEQNSNGLSKETTGGSNSVFSLKNKPVKFDFAPPLLSDIGSKNNQNAAQLITSSNENDIRGFKDGRETDAGSLTNITTPKLSNALNSSVVNQPANKPQSKTHLDDSDFGHPIYKTDTFGPAGLKSLVSDMRRVSIQNPSNTGATANSQSDHENPGSPSKNEAPLISHTESNQQTENKKLPSSTFSSTLHLIVEESPQKPRKGYLSPTGEDTESIENSGRLGMPNFDDLAKRESTKSLASHTDIKQAQVQLPNKLNTSLTKLVLDLDQYSGDEKHFSKRDDSFLNPTDDVLESPKPCDLLDHPDLLPLPITSSITKKCFEFSNSEVYKLECILERSGIEMRIKIILSAAARAGEPESLVATEIIKMKDIRKILKHVEYQDVMPLSTSLKSIKTFANFMKYCFVPFIWICQEKPIELRAKSKGLLNDDLTHLFFAESCIVGLYYLSQTNCRVVLTNLNTGVSFRIEVHLDDSSFNKFFELYSDAPVANYSDMIIQTTDILEDEDADAEELKEVKAIVEKAEELDVVKEEIQVCKFKGQNEEKMFVDSLMDTLIGVETYLGTLGYDSFEKLTLPQTTKFTKLHYFQEAKKRDVTFLVETPETAKYKVYKKNFFQTFAPDGVKIYAEGHSEYHVDSFCHEFGVEHDKIDPEDRIAFCSLVSDCYELKTHDKPIDEEDRESYEANPIIHMPVDNGCFYRVFKGTQFKFPTTFTLVGVRGYPVGVRTTVFNPEQCKECGVFMFLEPSSWKKVAKALKPGEKKKRTRKYVGLPMIEEYNLAPILKGYGFKILDDYVTFESAASRIKISGVRSMGGFSCVDTLENAVTIQNVIRYLKKNTDLFEGLLML